MTEPVISYWAYRVVKHIWPSTSKSESQEFFYGIHRVIFRNGCPTNVSESLIVGDNVDDLRLEVSKIEKALTQSVIDFSIIVDKK